MRFPLCLLLAASTVFGADASALSPQTRAEIQHIESQLVALNRESRLNESKADKAKASAQSLRGRADVAKDPESKRRLEKAFAKQGDLCQFYETVVATQRQSIADLAAQRHVLLGEDPAKTAPALKVASESKRYTNLDLPIFAPDFSEMVDELNPSAKSPRELWLDLSVPKLPPHVNHVMKPSPSSKNGKTRSEFEIHVGYFAGDDTSDPMRDSMHHARK